MIRSLTIDNFRGFEHFELHGLGRVNLIVGSNNSGKTSILEAVELLTANGDASVVSKILSRRAEDIEELDVAAGERKRFLDVRRLFRGHQVEIHNRFNLFADRTAEPLSFSGDMLAGPTSLTWSELDRNLKDENPETRPGLQLILQWNTTIEQTVIARFADNGAIPSMSLRPNSPPQNGKENGTNTRFISAASIDSDEAIKLFNKVQLRPVEEFVYDALRVIEKDVIRLAIDFENLNRRPIRSSRGGLSVLLFGSTEPVPIGSMGEGIWRMLGLALCLARAENGILLIDEIDTGLHYSVMVKMWKMVTETARKLNIQVFATSHSRDCYESLAAVCRESVTDNSEVTIQRIERGKKRSVTYTEQEIVIAAEHGTEVR